MNIHVPVRSRSYKFGTYDRITHANRTYRYIGKEKRVHILQLVSGDFVEDHYVRLSDSQIDKAYHLRQFSHEVGFFSLIEKKLRIRHDDSSLHDLNDVQLVRIHWRHRWVMQFLKLEGEGGHEGRPRTGRSQELLAVAVEHLAPGIAAWVAETFEGKPVYDAFGGPPPTPSGSTLYALVRKFEAGDYKLSALKEDRANCGNRDQLHPEVRKILAAMCDRYMSRHKPLKAAIVRDVHDAIDIVNLERGDDEQLPHTSPRIVRKRIDALDPFSVKLGRDGRDAAERWFTLVGKGIPTRRPMQRIEIDDWEIDLQTLLCTTLDIQGMTEKERKLVERDRCTLTAAIDCCTGAIVGINLAPHAPDGSTSKACLKSMSIDKAKLAQMAGCESDWPMYGRPAQVVTDNGPPFRLEFGETVRQISSGRAVPESDPRMRGHIERFFGTLARDFTTWFSGRTHANVVAKGDYQAEEMASITFEQLLHAIVRWIVDVYHNTPHFALDGRTPLNVWNSLAGDEEGLESPLTAEEVKWMFGFPRSVLVRREGLLFLCNYYQSEHVAWLLKHRPNRQVEFRVDPDDLGSILLVVPKEFRERKIFGGRHFVAVPCVRSRHDMRGVTLQAWLREQKEVWEFARRENAEGNLIRIAGRLDLFLAGTDAILAAGIADHALTQKTFDRAVDAVDRKGRAALDNPADRKPDKGASEPNGTFVAVAGKKPLAASGPRGSKTFPSAPPGGPDKATRPVQARFDNDEDDLRSE